METNMHEQKPSSGRTFLLLLLCVCASVAAAVALPAYLLLPGLFAYAMFRMQPGFLALFAAAQFAASYLLGGDVLLAVCLTALAALPALAIWYMQKRRLGNVYTCVACAGLSLAALYGMVCLPGILSGEGAFAAVQAIASNVIGTYRAILTQMTGLTDEMVQQFGSALDLAEQSVSSFVVPALCACACVLALSNLLFFRLFARKRDFGLEKLRPFSVWALPHGMTGGLAFLLVASLVLELIGWDYAASLGSVVNVIVGFPLIIQGLCLLDFMILRSKKRIALKRSLFYTLAGLFFTLVQTPLVIMGCFDQIFRIRERLTQGPAQPTRV